MLDLLELVWGRDFMAPGGPGNIRKMVNGLDLVNRSVLDIGSGLGGPAFLLGSEFGAIVTGIDLESKLVNRATARALALGLRENVSFQTVEAGPLTFPNNSFDLVISSAAITQTADKLGMFKEIFRVLKPAGTLSCYDWMKTAGELSEDMLYWIKMEGLTFAMETLERHGEILEEAGFSKIRLEDASQWYRREARREYEQISGPLKSRVVELIGQADADHLEEDWRSMVVVCEKGEMREGYYRATKP